MKIKVLKFMLAVLILSGTVICNAKSGDTAPILSSKKSFVIDGSADDWPIPATVFLKSKYGNSQMRFASDNGNFYAFVEVEDSSPLMNSSSAPEEMFKGGDTVAFYFNSAPREGYWRGPQKVAFSVINGEKTLYVYRPKAYGKPHGMRKPYIFKSPAGEAEFGYVAPFDDTYSRKGYEPEVAYKVHGKKGYSVEIKIPWFALRMSSGDLTGFDAQIVFSNPAGNANVGSAWVFATEGPGMTIEDLPTEARLYPDTWGMLDFVRQIPVQANEIFSKFEKRVGGTEFEVDLPKDGFLTINITDKDGWILRELVMAKKYTAGKHSVYWDGRDRYGEPLPPGEYLWKGILFDHMRTKFMGSVGNSGRPPYRTPDGLGSMGGQHGSTKTVALDDGGVYMSNALREGPPVMRKIDADTGEALWQCASAGKVYGIAADEGMACVVHKSGSWGKGPYEIMRIDPETGSPLNMGDGSSRFKFGDDVKDVSDIAIAGGYAWVSQTSSNMISSVSLTAGKAGKEFKVKSPTGLTRKDAKTLLVCSEDKIISLNIDTGVASQLIKGLESPRAVYVDNNGNIYVSELGSTQQVKKFSADGKKQLDVFGKKGGKSNQQIPYEPESFRNVTDLAVGKDGNIWLAESDSLVKRFVKLDSKGNWMEDFYGPVAYNTFGPDLDDLSKVYYTIGGGNFIETKVDYDQYQKDPKDPAAAWQVKAIHSLGLGADGKTVNETMKEIAAKGYGHIVVFKADNGQRYLFRFSKSNRAVGLDGAGLWIEKDKRWIPCALISKDTEKVPSWADKNGDGLIQENEQYINMPPVGEISWIDKDLTVHGFKGKLTVGSFTDIDAPVYTGGNFEPYLAEDENDYLTSGWTFFSRENDGSVYYIVNHGPHRHLGFWDRATENRLVRVKDGKVQWTLGKHESNPGFVGMSTCSGVAGSQDGIVLVNNIEPCNYVAYTEDGFVLGDIMVNEEGWHENYKPYTINIESFTGLYIKDPKTGKNVLFTVSSGDNRILEVIGPKNVKRMQGTVKLSKAEITSEDYEIPYSTHYGSTVRGMGVDAEDTEWNPEIRTMQVANKEHVAADVRLRRDAGNLYIFYSAVEQDIHVGDGFKVTISNTKSARGKYEFFFKLNKDKDGDWICVPEALRNEKKLDTDKIKTSAKTRWQNMGYRIEAEIPIELMPELSAEREVKFKRHPKNKNDPNNFKEVKPDLKAPIYIDIQTIGSDIEGSLSEDGELVKTEINND